MKHLSDKCGFSLVELVVGMGIASALSLLVLGNLKLSTSSKNKLERTTEINMLIQKITSELSRKEVCEKNFKGLSPTATAQNLTSINNKNGSPIISANTNYGDIIKPVKTITYLGASSGVNSRLFKMNVIVGYQAAADAGKTFTPKQFSIPVNVFLNASGAIDTCYADMQSLLENAVQFACQGNGAKYYPKDTTYIYGHCEHEAEIRDSNNTVVLNCPTGELLQLIDTSTNKMTFRCSKFTTTTSCPAWNYLKGVNSDGSANCVDVRTLFPISGFAVIRSGTYTVQNISCPAGEILQRIDGAGNPVCVNPRRNYSCPVGKYVTGIDAAGIPTCSFAANRNACSAGYYMSAIDSVGNVTCTSPALFGSCGGNNVISGFDANGNVICTSNQP